MSLGRRRNIFCLFGGGDEGAAARIQGVTLAGALLDEAVLMPRSFVEQCCARCSVQGARLWFSCNPEGPGHWFYQEWVQKAGERNALYLHFTMEDNPGLSPQVRERYRTMFQGTFYRRFVLGEWTAAAGLVYDFFSREMVCEPPEGRAAEWYISCDYGTVNPTSMGLWGRWGEAWYRVEEFYYDSRREGRQKTDSEYADALEALADGRPIREVVGRPLRRQLSGVPAAAGLAGAAGGERGALRHPHHGGAAADGPAGHLSRVRRRHPGVRAVPLGHQRRRAGPGVQGT